MQINTALIKPFLPQILKGLDKVDEMVSNALKGIDIDEDTDERYVAYILLADANKRIYIVTGVFDYNDKLIRIAEKQLLQDFIKILISKI